MYMRDTQEQRFRPWNGLSHHLKYLQLKKKKKKISGAQLWEVIRQNTGNKGKVGIQISVGAFSIGKSF